MVSIAEKLVAGGSSMARIDGKVVFIPLALPGETVDIEITECKKDFSFAKVVSVLEGSPHRVAPPCPLFGRCGGCSLQMCDDEYQRTLRRSILKDVLSRARVECESELAIESGDAWGYRSRFQFHRSAEASLGLKEGSSREVVRIDDCPIAVPKIREALRSGALEGNFTPTEDRLHVFANGDEIWVEGIDEECAVKVLGQSIHFDVRGFFQSNIPMLERLSLAIFPETGGISGKRLLDLYSGVGTFSAFAGNRFEDVTLVEHNDRALELARKNLAHRGREPLLCAVSDDRWPRDKASRLRYDAAIVDPPRQGISPPALDWLVSSGIPELRYVSCDPVTFARDARKLIDGGFRFKAATLFDFYPQTHHIETLGVFSR
jgi:23S rRNA (uracil1939-C5)-methyltransferase